MGAPKGTRPPNAGKGRRKGVPNKVTSDVRDMIVAALHGAGGEAYLTSQAHDNPSAFLSLVGRALPKELKVDASGAITFRVVTGVPLPDAN